MDDTATIKRKIDIDFGGPVTLWIEARKDPQQSGLAVRLMSDVDGENSVNLSTYAGDLDLANDEFAFPVYEEIYDMYRALLSAGVIEDSDRKGGDGFVVCRLAGVA
jgi:hypothetical protein